MEPGGVRTVVHMGMVQCMYLNVNYNSLLQRFNGHFPGKHGPANCPLDPQSPVISHHYPEHPDNWGRSSW